DGGFNGLIDSLLGKDGYKQDRHIRKRFYSLLDSLRVMFHGIGFLILYQVPFVHQDHDPLVIALCQPEDILYLSIKTTGGIQHKDTDIGMFYGPNGAHYGVKLKIFLNFGLAPYPGGIHQIKFESKAIVPSIYTVPSGTGNVGNYIPFFPDKGIYERGFPRIW